MKPGTAAEAICFIVLLTLVSITTWNAIHSRVTMESRAGWMERVEGKLDRLLERAR